MAIRTPLPEPAYLPHEVARMFGVHPRTLTSWRVSGKIKYYKTPGGRARYPRDTTDALLAARQARP